MVAASIDHPNVIPVYEAGEEDGALFIAMRWVEGTDLRELIDRGALDPAAPPTSSCQLAERPRCGPRTGPDPPRRQAGEHSHHRPRPRLPDRLRANEARELDQRADQDRSVGRHGRLHGARADRGRAVAPADRRLLARLPVLFEALTGRPPYKRENELATLWAHVYKPPPSVREISPELPAGFDDVIQRAHGEGPGGALRLRRRARPARAAAARGSERGRRRRRRSAALPPPTGSSRAREGRRGDGPARRLACSLGPGCAPDRGARGDRARPRVGRAEHRVRGHRGDRAGVANGPPGAACPRCRPPARTCRAPCSTGRSGSWAGSSRVQGLAQGRGL